MAANPANFDKSLRSLGDLAPEALCPHPDYRDLADYVDDTLSPAMTEAVQEHIAFCEACADVVLALMEPSSSPEPKVKPLSESRVTPSRRKFYLQPIAALLALLAIASLWWLSSAKAPSPPSPDSPTVLADVADVEFGHFATATSNLGEAQTRGKSSVELHRGDPTTKWGLQWDGEPALERYQVRISADGKTLWKSPAHPDPMDSTYFGIQLAPDYFAPGSYTIELLAADDATQEPLATWTLFVHE